MKKKVLILSPHADDVILGCGGFMSKYYNNIYFKLLFIFKLLLYVSENILEKGLKLFLDSFFLKIKKYS